MSEVFPRISLIHEKDLRYYPVNTSTRIRVVLYKDKNSEPEFVDGYEVFSLDPFYVSSQRASDEIYDNADDLVISQQDEIVVNEPKAIRLYFKNPGTGIVKAVYLYTDENGNKFNLTDQIEFLVYEKFFTENYEYLWTDFEIDNLKKNPKLKVMMETMLEYLDIIFTYKFDMQYINDARYVKYKYLATLGRDLGFERIDFEDFDSAGEYVSSTLYREILTNLYDILSIRGTPLSYELLFNALGYDITIKEFWWDDVGNLIEINPYDDELSTFYAYDTNGIPLDIPQVPRKDPRGKGGPNNLYNRNSKSNYIKVDITPKIQSDYIPTLATFSKEKKMALRKYLEFLRPEHVNHLQQVLNGAITESPEIAEFISLIGEKLHIQKNQVIFGPEDITPPVIDNVIILSPNTLCLVISEDVSKISSESMSNVIISKDPDGGGPSPYGNLSLLTLARDDSDKKLIFITLPEDIQSTPTTYLAIIQNVFDLNGVEQVYNSFAFNETLYNPPSDPGGVFELVSTTLMDSKTVKLVFSKAVDASSILDVNNFEFDPEIDFNGATVDPNDLTIVYLHISNAIHNQEYTVTLNNIESLYAETFNGDTTFIGLGENINPDTGLPLPEEHEVGTRINTDILFNPTDKLILSANQAFEEILGYVRRWDGGWRFDTESKITSREINTLAPVTIVSANNNNKFQISFDDLPFLEITVPILLPATSVTYNSASVLAAYLNTLIKNLMSITPSYTAYYTDNLEHSWVYADGDKLVFQSANSDVENRIDFIASTQDTTNILTVLGLNSLNAPGLDNIPKRYDEYVFVNESLNITRQLSVPPGF